MKTWGLRLMIAGVGLQLIDVATDGKVFGAGGFLAGIDGSIPKVTLPWPSGVQTNLAAWMIAGGAVMYFAG